MPGLWLFQYAFLNGGSVPHCCVTANCSEERFCLSSVVSGFLKSFMVSVSLVVLPAARGGKFTAMVTVIATAAAASHTRVRRVIRLVIIRLVSLKFIAI